MSDLHGSPEAPPPVEGARVGHPQQPPAQETEPLRADSLAMFGAAVGGAVLSMLLTLLVVALLNGGTVRYGDSAARMAAMQASLQRTDENLGAVSNNVDIVAEQTAANQADLVSAAGVLNSAMETQDEIIVANQAAIVVLDQTRADFDIFVGAIADALEEMESNDPVTDGVANEQIQASDPEQALGEDKTPPVADAPQGDVEPGDVPQSDVQQDAAPNEAAPDNAATGDILVSPASQNESTASPLPVPMVANRPDVPPQSVLFLLFADADGDGMMGEDEVSLVGASATLFDADGAVVASAVSDETGALFPDLAPGAYELVVDDALGYDLLSQPVAILEIAEDDLEGYVVFVPAATVAGP